MPAAHALANSRKISRDHQELQQQQPLQRQQQQDGREEQRFCLMRTDSSVIYGYDHSLPQTCASTPRNSAHHDDVLEDKQMDEHQVKTAAPMR